jgi:hypothetical protein
VSSLTSRIFFGTLSMCALLSSVALAQTEEALCWKQNFTRGVGTVGTACGSNQEKQDGLCYPKCAAGYTPVGPLCWRICPSGWTDIGVSCAKPAPIHTPGYAWQWGDAAFSLDGARARCQRDWGVGNCYTSGALVFRSCPANYRKFGDDICTPVCPANMRDDGAFCAKDTPTRGAGTIPTCGSGLESDTGLCYPSCGAGFSGVGPVCWGTCPANYPAQCGAACAKSAEACAVAIGDMVLNTVGVAINAVGFFVGPGVGAAANAAKAAAKTVRFGEIIKSARPGLTHIALLSSKAQAKAYAKEFVKTMLKNQIDRTNLYVTAASLTKSGTLAAMNKAATEFGVLEAQETFSLKTLMVLDITGISSMVNSFAKYGSCTADDFIPSWKSMDFGEAGTGTERTLTLTAQQPMTITRIAAPAFENCGIVPQADCINKELRPGQTCTIRVDVSGTGKLNSELRIYTHTYSEIPYAVGIVANSDAPNACNVHPTEDEAVNMTFAEGVWAPSSVQGNKIVIQNGGQVEGYLGNGTASVKSANARQFDLQFNNYTSYNFTGTLDDLNSNLTITYSPKSNPAVVYGLNTFVRRPWDSRCNPGHTFFAGLCYDVGATHDVTAPGFIGKPCPPDWRDDGTSCYPAWTGKVVAAQADPEGSFTIRHPIIVTDCFQYATAAGQTCPANFKNTGGPAGCSCEAQPTSKEVRSMIGSIPIR